MSGGSLGQYGFHRASEVADELRALTGNTVYDRYEDEMVRNPWLPETRAAFESIARLLDLAAQAWKDADWLISGDTSEGYGWLSPEVAAWIGQQ